MPEGTTFVGVVLKQFLVGVMAFMLGVMLYRAWIYERLRGRRWLTMAFFGLFLLLVPIGELIIRAPLIDPTWEAIMFTIGLTLSSVGFLVDSIKNRHANGKVKKP